MSCNKLAPAKLRSKVDLSDTAVSLMDFFNVETDFDIVLSLAILGGQRHLKQAIIRNWTKLDSVLALFHPGCYNTTMRMI